MIMNSQIPSAFAEGERELTGASYTDIQLKILSRRIKVEYFNLKAVLAKEAAVSFRDD